MAVSGISAELLPLYRKAMRQSLAVQLSCGSVMPLQDW